MMCLLLNAVMAPCCYANTAVVACMLTMVAAYTVHKNNFVSRGDILILYIFILMCCIVCCLLSLSLSTQIYSIQSLKNHTSVSVFVYLKNQIRY